MPEPAALKPVAVGDLIDALRVAAEYLDAMTADPIQRWGSLSKAREQWPTLFNDVDRIDGVLKAVETAGVAPSPVAVAVWSHAQGQDAAVFSSPAKAEEWRQQIAVENWEQEIDTPRPVSPAECAERYFDRMAERTGNNEFFEVTPNVTVDREALDRRRLFNCQADDAEPDWTRFTHLEIGGVIRDPEDDTFFIGGHTVANAEFFTIYGRMADGDADAITNCATLDEADAVGLILSQRSGLEIVDYRLERDGPVYNGPSP